MKELNFDTGVQVYKLNGKKEVSFNPTDASFMERLNASFEELDGIQEEYKARAGKADENASDFFEFAHECDQKMRSIIDAVFQDDVCDALFGDMNVYALAGGVPAWVNLMLAIMDEVKEAIAQEGKATNPKIAKYTAKYRKGK